MQSDRHPERLPESVGPLVSDRYCGSGEQDFASHWMLFDPLRPVLMI